MSDSVREEHEVESAAEHKVELVICDRNVKTEPVEEEWGEDEFVYGGTLETESEEKLDDEFLSVGEMKKESAEEQETDFAISHMLVETEIIETPEKIFPDWPEEDLMESRYEADYDCQQDPLSTSIKAVDAAPSSSSKPQTGPFSHCGQNENELSLQKNLERNELENPSQTKNGLKYKYCSSEMSQCVKNLKGKKIKVKQKCTDTEVNFSRKQRLRKQRTTQVEKPHKCEVCNASFKHPFHLGIHKNVHTGEKPYKCDKCETRFTDPSSLRQHQNIHTGDKPYKCNICGVRFNKSSNLRQHENIHTGEKPYKCDACGVGFCNRSNLCRHYRVHTREKPHKCKICGACFSQSGVLVRHQNVHIGEKPHKCKICGACFIRSSGLVRHQSIHIGKTP